MPTSAAITYLPLGLRSASTGTRLPMRVKSSIEFHFRRVRHGQQVQHGVGGTAEGDNHRDGVVERLASHDVARLDAEVYQVQHRRSRLAAIVVFLRRNRRLGRAIGQAHAQRLDG